jgi:hypothetical protein
MIIGGAKWWARHLSMIVKLIVVLKMWFDFVNWWVRLHCSSFPYERGGPWTCLHPFIFNMVVQPLLLYLACLSSYACLLSSYEKRHSEQRKVYSGSFFGYLGFLSVDRLCTTLQEGCRHIKQLLMMLLCLHDFIFEYFFCNICETLWQSYCGSTIQGKTKRVVLR